MWRGCECEEARKALKQLEGWMDKQWTDENHKNKHVKSMY